jgi:hypothetical protein
MPEARRPRAPKPVPRRSWRLLLAGLIVTVVVAALTLVPPSRAAADAPYPPAPLLSEALISPQASGLYTATPAQHASLVALQTRAVALTAAAHGLTSADADAVQTWARDDALAMLWVLIDQAVTADPRTADQQNVVDWLAAVALRQQVLAAKDAGLEYAKWAGIGADAYQAELAGDPTVDQLTAFLQRQPVGYGPGMTPSSPRSTDNTGYCVYSPPEPLAGQYTANIYTTGAAGTTPSECYVPSQNPLNFSPPTPEFDQFVQWGAADADSSYRTLSWTATSMASLQALSFVGVASGSSAITAGATALVASLNAANIAPALTAAIASRLDAFLAEMLGKIANGVAIELSEASVARAATQIVAKAVPELGGAVAIVLVALEVAIEASITFATAQELPGKIATVVLGAPTAPPDLGAMLADPTRARALFGLFIGAAGSDPALTDCDNSVIGAGKTVCLNAPGIPAPSAADTTLTIADESGTGTGTAFPSWDAATGIASSTRLDGPWFIQTMTASDGSTLTRQTLSLPYTDGDGVERVAWIVGDATSGYHFVQLALGTGDAVDPATCAGKGLCSLDSSLQVVDAAGHRLTVTLPAGSGGPPVPAVDGATFLTGTTLAADPAAPRAGRPATLTATIWNSLDVSGGRVDFDEVADGVDMRLCSDVQPTPYAIPTGEDPPTFRSVYRADCAVTFATTGPHHVYATYAGAAGGGASSQGDLLLTVGDIEPSSLTVTADATTPALDAAGRASVVYSAAVRDYYGGGAAPTGTVTFSGGGSACIAVPLHPSGADAVATCTVDYASAGRRTVTAQYSGDDGLGPSSGSASVTVLTGPVTLQVHAPVVASTAQGTIAITVDAVDGAGNPVDGGFHVGIPNDADTHRVTSSYSTGAVFAQECGTVSSSTASCTYVVQESAHAGPMTFGVDFGYNVVGGIITSVATRTFTVDLVDPVTVYVQGDQRYGASGPTLSLAEAFSFSVATQTATPLTSGLSGSLVCTRVTDADGAVHALDASLPAGTYTIDFTSCSGLVAAGGAAVAYRARAGGFTVTKTAQTIDLTAPATGTVGGHATLSAIGGGSGNPVVLSVDASSDPGVCTLDGAVLRYDAAGRCVVDADQAGDAAYDPAPRVRRTVVVDAAGGSGGAAGGDGGGGGGTAKGASTVAGSDGSGIADTGLPSPAPGILVAALLLLLGAGLALGRCAARRRRR